MAQTLALSPHHSAPKGTRHTGHWFAAHEDFGEALAPRQSAPGARPKPARADPLAGSEGCQGRGALADRPQPRSYRTYFASFVEALSSDSSGPRRKNRDQSAANTIAPRMNVSTGSHDTWLLSPVGMSTTDCTTKWPT